MNVSTYEVDDRTIVVVTGGLDVYTAPKLRSKVTELITAGAYDLVVDIREVEFLDSTGLGVLVGILKKVHSHNGSLRLLCNQTRLLRTFHVTGLAKVFEIHDDSIDDPN